MWSRQVHALLDGYDLASLLDVSKQVREPVITVNGTTSENPAYVMHKRQDKLLYSAILGVISLSIQSLLSKAATTAEIRGTSRLHKCKTKPWSCQAIEIPDQAVEEGYENCR